MTYARAYIEMQMLRPETIGRMSSARPTKPSAIPATTPSSPIVRSALWAAWGDALGFPAELADERILQRRLDGAPEGRPQPWVRRIGGRMGPSVELPAGCTSDDTQLRLAVGRCIRTSGRFDVEAFSKIELPVFLSYQLGAGRGTKAAAQALERRSNRWFSNFFDTRGSRYVDGGGNGAAMRVQPHVWAARNGKPDTYLVPLLRDVVTTHGHPRAILGAALHALALGTSLRQEAIPEPDRWAGMVAYLSHAAALLRSDDVLADRWLPAWETAAGGSFDEALEGTIRELTVQAEQAADAAARVDAGASPEHLYSELARSLGGLDARTRGAGTVTAVLSLWIAQIFRDRPAQGLRVCAETLGSDTDTVATMAGALLGTVASEDPPGAILDRDLIASEALRLWSLAEGNVAESFPHPDPLRWQPPPSLSDALGLIGDVPAVAGLGAVELLSELITGQGKQAGTWQWVLTAYGQRLLIKRRPELQQLPETALPRHRAPASTRDGNGRSPLARELPREPTPVSPSSPEDALELLIRAGMPDELLGRLVRHFAQRSATEAAVFATLVSVALRNRGAMNG